MSKFQKYLESVNEFRNTHDIGEFVFNVAMSVDSESVETVINNLIEEIKAVALHFAQWQRENSEKGTSDVDRLKQMQNRIDNAPPPKDHSGRAQNVHSLDVSPRKRKK